MQLLAQSYDPIELQLLRSELEKRGIKVHIADEFTYSIPGMPGAEKPRGVWVTEEDIMPARQVVEDLFGADRIHHDDSEESNPLIKPDPDQIRMSHQTATWLWVVVGLIIVVVVVLSSQKH